MNKVLELKRHISNIFNAIEVGEYKKGYFCCEYKVPETNIVHKHNITYFNRGQDICYNYNYTPCGLDKKHNTHLGINTTVDDSIEENSVIIITEEKELAFKFVPATMDRITVAIRHNGEVAERISLKDFLTEEQFFMYSTLYDIPDYEYVRVVAVMGQEFRGLMMRKRVKMQGMIAQEVVDIESEEFLYEVMHR